MSNDATAELIELERRRGAALVARDAAALDALFPDELVHIHSTGNVMNKPEIMNYVLKVLQFFDVQRSDVKVQLYGDVAVMTGRMATRMQRVDKPDVVSADSWVTQVWVRRAGTWVQTNFHATRAAAPV